MPMLGIATSNAEVTHISANGAWVLVGEKEFFLSYTDFPWFRNARVEEILALELQNGFHLYWPRLDVDLAIEQLEDPAKFPLVSR